MLEFSPPPYKTNAQALADAINAALFEASEPRELPTVRLDLGENILPYKLALAAIAVRNDGYGDYFTAVLAVPYRRKRMVSHRMVTLSQHDLEKLAQNCGYDLEDFEYDVAAWLDVHDPVRT